VTEVRPRVVVLDDWEGRWSGSPDLERLRAVARVRVFSEHLDASSIAREASDAAIIVLNRERTRVDAALLERLEGLRAIVNTGVGLGHLDRAAAKARGVRVVATGGDYTPAVVEATFALMLAALKRLPELDSGLRAGEFPEAIVLKDLHGARIGIAGVGNVGTGVARVALAFGMTVAGWSPSLTDLTAASLGISRSDSLEALAASSDVFAVCLRLLPETRGIVSSAIIGALPRGALFVNTARAELCDTAALLARAERGEILVALDVYEHEPAVDPRYRTLAGALSPHVGWKTEATWATFVRIGVDRVLELLGPI
jgi:D-3-phosphoglycerate dehydrogenase / 2-oxoglutarate reductase